MKKLTLWTDKKYKFFTKRFWQNFSCESLNINILVKQRWYKTLSSVQKFYSKSKLVLLFVLNPFSVVFASRPALHKKKRFGEQLELLSPWGNQQWVCQKRFSRSKTERFDCVLNNIDTITSLVCLHEVKIKICQNNAHVICFLRQTFVWWNILFTVSIPSL